MKFLDSFYIKKVMGYFRFFLHGLAFLPSCTLPFKGDHVKNESARKENWWGMYQTPQPVCGNKKNQL